MFVLDLFDPFLDDFLQALAVHEKSIGITKQISRGNQLLDSVFVEFAFDEGNELI